jgi:hypothetical protein
MSQMFVAPYMAMRVPLRETEKPKDSGNADDEAVLEMRSKMVVIGLECP